MGGNQTILIFFRLLNFAVLIAIMAYLWKRYGRSYVVDAYEQEHAHLEGLTRTHTVLRKEERLLKKGYGADDQERALLKERLFAWREAIQKEQDAQVHEKEQRIVLIEKRVHDQLKRVDEYRIYRGLKREAIDEVRGRLSKQYNSEQAQNQVMEEILKRLDGQ